MARTKAGMSIGTCRFFTLTSPGTEDGDTSYEQFPERWKQFRMRVERRWGRIEYIAVVERQKRGAAHVHVVYRGPFIPQQWLSRVAAECGFGRVADIRRSNPKLMRYLAKYLTKELSDPKAGPPRYFRRVRWSRGWCVWEKRSRAVPYNDWWILDTRQPTRPPKPLAAASRSRRWSLTSAAIPLSATGRFAGCAT